MLSYVAAVATAVTLIISPVLSSSKDRSGTKEPAKWAKQTDLKTIEIPRLIEISGQPPYVLSTLEQQIFRRALLRSVKIVGTGNRIA